MDDDVLNISDDGSDFASVSAPVQIDSSETPRVLITNNTTIRKPKAKAAPKKEALKVAAKKVPQTTLKLNVNGPAKKAKADSEDEMYDAHKSNGGYDSLLFHTPPNAKKAAGPKRAGLEPLADIENETYGGEGTSDVSKKKGNAPDKYQKVSCTLQPVFREAQR